MSYNKQIGQIMREVNNNPEFGKIPQRSEIKFNKADETNFCANSDVEEKSLATFDNPKAEILGRSHVSSPDAIQNDISFAMKHPDAIESADKFFDHTYNQLVNEKHPDPYGRASELTAAYVDEFHK